MTSLKISAMSTASVPDNNADVTVLVQGGTTKKVPIGRLGGIIAYARYTSTTNLTTTSATFVDADATNLKVTFVAPPSGKVLITACCTASNSGDNPRLNIRTAGSDVANSSRIVAAVSWVMSAALQWVVTGLTPGTSYAYTLGFRAASGTCTIFGSNVQTPTMFVFAIPA